MRSNRPSFVTFTTLVVLTITAFYITRIFQTIKLWDFLRSLDSTVSPFYFLITGFVFGLAGIPLVYGLWVGAPWARRGVQIFAAVVIIFYWIERLSFANPSARNSNWPFAVFFTAGLLATLFLGLSHPTVRTYFKKTDLEK